MKKTDRITVTRLRKLGACKYQLRRFKRLYPRGLKITERNAVKASGARINVEWWIDEMLYERYLSMAADTWYRNEFSRIWADETDAQGYDACADATVRLAVRTWHKFKLLKKAKEL